MLDIPLLPNQKTISTWEILTSQISVGKASVGGKQSRDSWSVLKVTS